MKMSLIELNTLSFFFSPLTVVTVEWMGRWDRNDDDNDDNNNNNNHITRTFVCPVRVCNVEEKERERERETILGTSFK